MDENLDTETPAQRAISVELENVLGKTWDVLDHGFIRVVDYMGSDESIVQAARVSYGKGTKSISNDTALIRYLLRHDHTTPFEMCEIKLHIKLPIFVARQWIRHRTASVNEYSGRYSVMDSDFYVPEPGNLAAQSSFNRQGRGQPLGRHVAEQIAEGMRADAERSYSNYLALLGQNEAGDPDGLSREIARLGLGVNFYTQWYWKCDLHNLLHFLRLRSDPHAQYEIRAYADIIREIVHLWAPITYQAFLDYKINATVLSAQAKEIITRSLSGEIIILSECGLTGRELAEFREQFPEVKFS